MRQRARTAAHRSTPASRSAGRRTALLIYSLLIGTVFGASFGAIGHAALGGRRDFASSRSMQAERYEVQVEETHADEPRQLVDAIPAGRP